MPRKPLPNCGVKGRLGRRGASVRAFTDVLAGKKIARVQWSEGGRVLTRSWPDTPANRDEARAFAEGVADRLAAIARGVNPDAPTDAYVPVTLRELWTKYLTAHDHLRPRSRANYKERWTALELFMGAHSPADALTREDLDDLRAALKAKRVVNQIGAVIAQVKLVYRWAVDRDLVRAAPAVKVATYTFRVGKDERKLVIAAYEHDETERLIAFAGSRVRDPRWWRFYVALHLFAFAGPRHNAAEHLRWEDVDFDAGTVTWRSAWDKLGKVDRVQPVPPVVMDALRLAQGWALASGYAGPWVLFRPGMGTVDRGGKAGGGRWTSARQQARRAAKEDKPWTYSAALGRLRQAETATKVPHLKYRGFHGFRRYVVNQVLALTGGDLVLAGQYINDDDLRTLQRSYVRPRLDRLQTVAGLMGGESDSGANRNAVATTPGNDERPAEGGALQVDTTSTLSAS